MRIQANGIKTAFLVFVIASLVGCMNPFSGGKNEASSSGGSLTISMGTLSASTVLPEDIEAAIASYDVTLTGPDSISASRTAAEVTSNGGITVTNLVEGSWEVSVDALNGSSEVVATGSVSSVSVTDGGSATATVTLEPTTGGTGGLVELVVDWSGSSVTAIDGAVATLIDSSDTSADVTSKVTVDNGARTATFSDTGLASGVYTLSIRLFDTTQDPDLFYAAVVEAVHVYDNLNSTKTVPLTDSNMSSAPAVPTGLSAAPLAFSSSDAIELTWTDAAKTETGYEIEKSTDGGSSWTALTTLEAGATSYRDWPLTAETTYDYRVRSVNDFGVSSWASGSATTTALTEIYVSFTGDDANSGSGLQPVQTLAQALTLADPGTVADQVIRLEGSTGSDEYAHDDGGSTSWPGDLDLVGGWQRGAPGEAWTHSPGTHTTVIRETSGIDGHTIQFDSPDSGATISHLTLIDHDIEARSILRAYSATVVLDNLVLDARVTGKGHTVLALGIGVDVTITDSTIRNNATSPASSLSTSNGPHGILAGGNGSVRVTNTDIEIGAGYNTYGVEWSDGDFTMTGGSISFTSDAVEESFGLYSYWPSNTPNLTIDGVSIESATITDTSSFYGTRAIHLWAYASYGNLEIRNSTLTPGNGAGTSNGEGIHFRAPVEAASVDISGNTFTLNPTTASTGGNLTGITIGGSASSTLLIDGNTIVIGDDADQTTTGTAWGIGVTDGTTGNAVNAVITNNLVYQTAGSDADFHGIRTSDSVGAPLIANNTVVSLTTSTAAQFFGIRLGGSVPAEVVNNIIKAGTADQFSLTTGIQDAGALPSRLENNYVFADYLVNIASTTNDIHTITDLNDATKSTQGGTGTAAGNIGEGSGDTAGSAPTLGFGSSTGPYDFSLTASSATTLRTGGVDLSADFTTDITGAARNVGWSIGAYEY